MFGPWIYTTSVDWKKPQSKIFVVSLLSGWSKHKSQKHYHKYGFKKHVLIVKKNHTIHMETSNSEWVIGRVELDTQTTEIRIIGADIFNI